MRRGRDSNPPSPLSNRAFAGGSRRPHGTESGVDDHHIFPKGYFKDEQLDYAVDTVLNHTLIDRVTNIRIGKKAPSRYLAEIRAELGERLEGVLESHSLPTGAGSPLWHDDFPGLCDYRSAVLTDMVTEVTSE